MKIKIRFFLGFALFFLVPAFAGEIQVNQLDPNTDLSPLKKDYRVNTLENLKDTPFMLPSRSVREKAFASSGLASQLTTWDELERDMLYLSAQTKTSAELIKKYRKLDPKSLRQLQQLQKN